MTAKFLHWLDRISKPKNILMLVGMTLFFSFVVFPWFAAQRDVGAAQGIRPLDLQYAYPPQQAFDTIDALGENGRRLAAIGELTIDLLYPLVYSLTLATLLTVVFRAAFQPANPLRWLPLLPIAMLLCDYGENLSIVALILTHPAEIVPLAVLASIFSTAKWTLGGLSLIALVIGALRQMEKRVENRE